MEAGLLKDRRFVLACLPIPASAFLACRLHHYPAMRGFLRFLQEPIEASTGSSFSQISDLSSSDAQVPNVVGFDRMSLTTSLLR